MYRKPIYHFLIVGLMFATRPASAADAVQVVPQGSLPEARQPQAAIDERGTVYVALGSGNDVYVTTSSDAGKTFAEPVKVGSPGVLSYQDGNW